MNTFAKIGIVGAIVLQGAASAFATPGGIPAVTAPFSDIAGHPYQASIEYLYGKNVISGYDDGTFRPDNTINRAELLKILVGGAGYAKPDSTQYHDCFPDVKSEWYAPYVCFAKEKGWVNGYDDGMFRPSQSINKVEAVKMLMGMNFPPALNAASKTSAYIDVDLTKWYGQYLYAAEAMKIIDITRSNYYPASYITRGEISNNMYRAMLIMDQHVGSFDQVDLNKVGANVNVSVNPQAPAVTVAAATMNSIEFNVAAPAYTGDSAIVTYAYSIDASSDSHADLTGGSYNKDYFEKTLHGELVIGNTLKPDTSYTVSFWVVNAQGNQSAKVTMVVKTSINTL